ncbi:MAG: hypothetical protein PVH19_14855, partial [Planctomycetia bacterium]
GYDTATKERVGYLGCNGFQKEKPSKEDQFVDNAPWRRPYQVIFGGHSGKEGYHSYLLTEEGLVQINLKKRTAKLVLEQDNLVAAGYTSGMFWQGEKQCGAWTLLRTPEELLIFNTSDSKVEQAYKIPKKLQRDYLRCVRFWKDKYLVEQGCDVSELYWIEKTGKIIKSQKVELEASPDVIGNRMSFVAAASVPCPGFWGVVCLVQPWEAPARAEGLGYWAALGRAFGIFWPAIVLPGIVSSLLAFVCYRRQKKYGLGWTWFWVGVVWFFGLPAFLGYLAHRSWPARLPCPNCGELAPRDRDACYACHEKFPAPAPTGTEVFA